MTVWIINPFDNLPMEGFRPQRYWLMARAFAKAGHKVTYWTSDFSHAFKRRRDLRLDNREPEIEVRLVPTPAYPANICLRRIWSHRVLAQRWRRLAKACGDKPEAIIASLPPLGLCEAARRFAKAQGAIFVADIMDAWPETFTRVVPAWCLWPLRVLARRIYRGATAVSAVATRYLELAKAYGATQPMLLSYHGIELDGTPIARPKRNDGVLKLAYVGAMGASYDLETLIAAVKALPQTTLDLAGSGPKAEQVRAQAQACARIRYHGYLAADAMRKLLESSDAGVVPMFPASCVGVPYKLADYAAAGLRILECLGGETGELVSRYHAGVHYEPGNLESLEAALARLAEAPNADWDAQGLLLEFDAKRIMADYVAWVESLKRLGQETG